jgi:hypothetical protein
LVRSELGDSLEHLKAAAGHAAGGVTTAVRPRVDAARDFVVPPATRARDVAGTGWESTRSSIRPLASAATENAKKAARRSKSDNGSRAQRLIDKRAQKAMERSSSSGRRWPIIAAVLVAGAAFGAAAVMRRRRQQQWDEYDPSRSLDAARSGGSGGGRGHSHGRIGDATDAARTSVKTAASTAKNAANTARERLSSSSSSQTTRPTTTDPTASSDHMGSPNGHA